MKENILRFKNHSLLILFLLCVVTPNLSAQKRVKIYEDYIKLYKDVSIEHMGKYKIPASITLAQGLLESGAGTSSLAKKANNHFGIKCHSDWTGKKYYMKDDGPKDCFRHYNSVADSYNDHAVFLTKYARYSPLFKLDITDYKGWAKGLQTSGYATDKGYANKLIGMIETYELYEYDKSDGKKESKKDKKEKEKNKKSESTPRVYTHTPYKTGGLVYIFALDGDTYEDIADEFGFKVKDLCKYNEVPEDFPLRKGDKIYFQKKKNKADKPYYDHVVQVGESMHSISQHYGVKVKNLYKINKLDEEYVPTEGDVLKLR
ncbi:glucosaminidase domain-containing protein [Dysgonomonas sp. 520]|uniref:glucosaminidase domain-containing protein n=1 Tax=Dysgonomonas sp. 520 TaxID=2302931 RepID=UPI0013D404DD|nr:glucosaminidase domain-containing protein [Dysgonomonas sp. 520]NDW08852.1 LysM peptidoglycan-binding domain-containing protein [Dysgonomonas sp. 520]